MDGNAHTILHNTGLQTPYALTIDYTTQTLYWADYALNKLESSNTDGTNRTVLNTNLRNPYALTYFGGKLYWNEWTYNIIYTTRPSSPNTITSLTQLTVDPQDIEIIDETVQFEGI